MWKAPKGRRWTWCSWWPRGGLQDGPSPDPSTSKSPRRHSGLAGPSIPLNGAQQQMDPRSVERRFSPGDALAAEDAWMRSQGWRACIAPALFQSPQQGEWVSTKQTARSKGSAGIVAAAALRHGLATPHGGVGDRGTELCKGRVLALCHSGIAPGGALVLSVYMHTGAGLENPEYDWPVAHSGHRFLRCHIAPHPSKSVCPRGSFNP